MKKIKVVFSLNERKIINKVLNGEEEWVSIPNIKKDEIRGIVGVNQNQKYIRLHDYTTGNDKTFEIKDFIGTHLFEFADNLIEIKII